MNGWLSDGLLCNMLRLNRDWLYGIKSKLLRVNILLMWEIIRIMLILKESVCRGTMKNVEFKNFHCLQYLHQTQNTFMPIDHITCILI